MPSRRASIALTSEEQKHIIEDGWTLQVASNGPKGFPHLVAMWYAVIEGEIHFTTFRKSQKILNLRRNPKLTVMLEAGRLYNELRGLVIEGDAELIDDLQYTARVMSLVGNKYQGMPIRTETPEAALGPAAKRTTVRIHPVRIFSWDHSKLGGQY